MADSIGRQWDILCVIPHFPQSVSTLEIWQKLRDKGHSNTKRTVERDLERFLSSHFPLIKDNDGNANTWGWMRGARQTNFNIPGMGIEEALAFSLVRSFLSPVLPPSTLEALEPHFEQAKRTIEAKERTSAPITEWPNKVVMTTRGQSLAPPALNEEVVNAVYEALFLDRQLDAAYHSRRSGAVKQYVINPLGLVVRDDVIYLVCTFDDDTRIRTLPLQRMLSAQARETRASRPEDFDLEGFVNNGGMDVLVSEDPLDLRLRISNKTVAHLQETRLSENQEIDRIDDDWAELRATVPDTQQIRWWLLGLSDEVEVVAPESLRQEIAGKLQSAAALYTTNARRAGTG
ncbi:WYL domain-containing protein [Aquisalimonas sp. 2447]|uniref:helix-turn-helix transcriptional regulator n=1 Tax=Aquisalimonas sp. 2447 TaxID=2740807 RepID=UPI00143272F8|nr:WYL domain-containing protein [Aquisalimonas sp. 2447]QIT55033.1 WYL domain-containing protein [Aquisalimonas sp. 2447]